MPAPTAAQWTEMKAYFASFEQSHVFDHLNALSDAQRERLYADLKVYSRCDVATDH